MEEYLKSLVSKSSSLKVVEKETKTKEKPKENSIEEVKKILLQRI
jgi:hypothetical protein